ncbi:MAG: branched-chain amino acid ABC transporter permease, partial [Oscillospiraceae bacterium]
MTFVYHMLNGIHIGSVYALVALGYSMVYGIVKLINFAHGDIIMVGAYVMWYIISSLGLPVWLGILA